MTVVTGSDPLLGKSIRAQTRSAWRLGVVERKGGEREREREQRSGENKAFNRILFYRPHTTETTLANISRKQRQTPPLYYNSLSLFFFIYIHICTYMCYVRVDIRGVHSGLNGWN